MTTVSEVVAHRGWRSRYPENTWPAIEAAVAVGTPWVEFDLQFSADRVPVVIHDAELDRTAGRPGRVSRLHWSELSRVSVHEPGRFGDRHGEVRPMRLAELVERLADPAGPRLLVEVKGETALEQGVDRSVQRVIAELGPILERCVLISFVERAVQAARRLGAPAVGWCLDYYDEDSRRLADALAPDWLLADHREWPTAGGHPWEGPWSWGVWELGEEADLARSVAARGARLLETFACGELLAKLRDDPPLASR
jgi:glycerophosphoryl diester phosphodiesterase